MNVDALDELLAPWRKELRARAAERAAYFRALGPLWRRQEKWWRSRTKRSPFAERLKICGRLGLQLTCQGCGVSHVVALGCRARAVCKDCSAAAWKRARRRIREGFEARHAEALARWRDAGAPAGREPRTALITLTLAHSGDVPADRALLSDAWNRWRTWYVKRWGQLDYAWTVEITPGTDGLGHVHLHVATFLPRRDYRELRAAWERATEGQGQRIHVAQRKVRADGKRCRPADAARYLAKYQTKGVGDLPDDLAASWVRAQHARRSLSTSRAFYVRATHCHAVGFDGRCWPRWDVSRTLVTLDTETVTREAPS